MATAIPDNSSPGLNFNKPLSMAPRTSRPRSKKLKTEHGVSSPRKDAKKPADRPARNAKKTPKKNTSSSLTSCDSDNEHDEEISNLPMNRKKNWRSPIVTISTAKRKKTFLKPRKENLLRVNVQSSVVKNLAPGPPKDQLVIPGLIAEFTMELLKNLAKPECNDREWLIINDKTYRKALENWNAFVDVLCPKIVECDWTIPQLPAKDPNVRFASDKTPYKKYFSAGFSRTGRKGPWALYYLQIEPGGNSLLAGGIWCPDKNQYVVRQSRRFPRNSHGKDRSLRMLACFCRRLATIRNAIMRNPRPLRDVINNEEFIEMFGKPLGKVEQLSFHFRSSIFGHKDELKNCPKINGVDKTHPDVDLLKLKSIAATKPFTDKVVMSSSFVDEIIKAVKVLSPLVQCINEMILPQSDDEEEG
ncbi:hypothetical protein PSHT_05398 [Puccinia striiformis]|uniref:Uncharacterized protein n=1 Tax=Puccinia striiformis TaxID=27350 RepID=A0A2S4WAT5_9BASI|nr:hypothetical protein PSHT_05398 [Puccinia striiformis]